MAMKDEKKLIKDITEHLDQSAETLEPEILSRIRAARYNSLKNKRPRPVQWALPAGGIAVAVIALVAAVNLLTGPENRSTTETARIEDTSVYETGSGKDRTQSLENTAAEIQPDQIELVEILSSDQQLDLFENLEFYAWLSENEDVTG
jgi:hypothetical protein